MKLTGKEWVSLYAEKNGERFFTISQLNLNQLLNIFILDRICQQLIKNKNDEKLVTGYLDINDTKIFKGTKVSAKFRITLKKNNSFFKNTKYIDTYHNLDISEFYNHVVHLFDFYAKELNTVIDNVNLELVELEILKEENSDGN